MSTNFEDLILRGATGAKPAAGIPGRLYYDTSLEKWERDNGSTWDDCEPGAGGSGDVTYAALLASQLVNEIKGWPPCVNTGDLDALNLWWDKVGTPTTAPTVTDTSVAGLTDNYELCLKVVTDASGEGLSQRFTYADEPRVKSGRVVSALLAIWSVSAVSVTAKLVNSDASETAASAVTAAAWTIVEIPNHTLAGTYVDLQVTTGAAGTFYVVPLGMNIGARAFPLPPRPMRYVDGDNTRVVNGADPGGAYVDVDLTANTDPLACRALMSAQYRNNTSSGRICSLRRNGGAGVVNVTIATTTGAYYGASAIVDLDDGNVFEYGSSAPAGDTELVYLDIAGWWEWA